MDRFRQEKSNKTDKLTFTSWKTAENRNLYVYAVFNQRGLGIYAVMIIISHGLWEELIIDTLFA